MPNYQRVRNEGGTYFFTVVTNNRMLLFNLEESRRILSSAFTKVKSQRPFTIDAICILPDHIHTIWTLPAGDSDYSTRWKQIKTAFTRDYLSKNGNGEIRNQSRIKHGEAAIWQRRFWEHTIEDEQDYFNHLDYIHYNPVKHGLVQSPKEWLFSSFA
jgi:putative transposase